MKSSRFVLLGVVILLFAAGNALGALLPHSGLHDEGDCTACHNNNPTPRLRGWTPSGDTPGALAWWGRPIGGLCGTCHSGGPVGTGLGASDMTTKAAAAAAHGFDATTATTWPYTPESGLTGATVTQENYYNKGLPYAGLVGDGVNSDIDCTSCHNVHNNDLRPFLMKGLVDDSSELCKTCHAGRAISVVGTDNSLAGTGANYSTHPTDLPIADITTGGNGIAGFEPTIDGRFGRVSIAPAVKTDTFTLGGKRVDNTADGDFSCQTCHTVHGDDVLNNLPSEDLLAIPSVTLRPSALCKGCHTGGDLTESVGQGGTSDHPVDVITGRAFYPSSFATLSGIPSEWVASNHYDSGATGFDPATFQTPACSSCHDTHGGLEGTSLQYGPVPVAADGEWCFSCHAATAAMPAAHHSNIGNDVGGLGFISKLDCGDCHGDGSGTWGGHNGFWAFRNDVTVEGDGIAEGNSDFCEVCHVSTAPTTFEAGSYRGGDFTDVTFPSSHGTDRGNASHYLGPDSNEFDGISPNIDFWPRSDPPKHYSEYGGQTGGGLNPPASAGEIICESCHNIQYNDGTANPGDYTSAARAGWECNLLLEPYEDDEAGTTVGLEDPDHLAGNTGDALCTGCHTGSGTHHPIGAGLDMTKADQTVPAGAPNSLSFPSSSPPTIVAMDCDSCHRPHDADDDSVTIGGTHDHPSGGSTYHVLELDEVDHDWSVLCDDCHAK